jgi:oxygen-dependent protoporphyrinogen oxidase
MKRVPHVVVVGAGISGLAAAHRLLETEPGFRVSVFEGEGRTGGLIRSEHIDGCLVEQGPDSILTEKRAALELAERLGLQSEILPTNTTDRGAYVVKSGRLHRIPEGFSMMAPSRAWPLLASPILSPLGKLRMGLELALPRKVVSSEESVAEFVRRRFGNEVLERLAQPLMSGIYGTDPAELSLQSTMPRFLELERKYRSVTLGLLKQARAERTLNQGGVRYGLFFAFKNGNQTLTDALSERLAERLNTHSKVVGLQRHGDGFLTYFENREPELADAVILAIPARAMVPLLRDVATETSARLAEIRFGSTATVAYAWNEVDIPHRLDAFGFVVPRAEPCSLLASTWASKKFAGRAPAGRALIRVFIGGAHHAELVEKSDDELIELGQRELSRLLGIRARPQFASVGRQLNAMPQYTVGHAERVSAIEAQLGDLPRLALAGNSLHGVGIPDAVRAGERAAERVRLALAGFVG